MKELRCAVLVACACAWLPACSSKESGAPPAPPGVDASLPESGLDAADAADAPDAQAEAEAAAPPKLVLPAFDKTVIQSDIASLAGDGTEGRAAGTAANLKAVEFLEKAFGDVGLKPAGDAPGSYRQAFPLSLFEQTESPNVALAGETLVSSQGYTVVRFSGSGDVTSDVVFAGYGLVVPPFSAASWPSCPLDPQGFDEYAGIDVSGKIVLMRLGIPGQNEAFVQCPVQDNGNALEGAIQRGAAGIMLMLGPPYSGEALRGLSAAETMASSGVPVIVLDTPTAKLKIPSLAQWLSTIDSTLQPQSQPAGVTASLKVTAKVTQVESYNLLGELAGSDPVIGTDTVLLSGHIDGVGKDEQTGAVYAGANDNTTGTVATLRIAEQVIKRIGTPRRTLLFAVWNGEETGLNGSCYYADHPLHSLFYLTAVVNMEMLSSGDGSTMYVYGSDTPSVLWLHELIASSQSELGIGTKIISAPMGADSDHWCFLQKGVSAISLRGGGPAIGYHTPEDNVANINVDDMVAGMTSSWALVEALAQGLENSLPQERKASGPPRKPFSRGVWMSH